MKISRSLIVSALFVLIALITALWLYPQLPARMPAHWDIHGQVDRWGPKFWVAFFPALLLLALAALTCLLPAMSPRKFEIKPFAQVYITLMLAAQGTVLVIGMAVLLVGAGYPVPVPMVAMLALGALSMVVGNYTGKLRKNFFIGIRTPWTLTSDAVWERTHRLAGWLFMLGGAIAIIATLAGAPLWLALAAVIAAGLVPCIYSFWIYRALERRD